MYIICMYIMTPFSLKKKIRRRRCGGGGNRNIFRDHKRSPNCNNIDILTYLHPNQEIGKKNNQRIRARSHRWHIMVPSVCSDPNIHRFTKKIDDKHITAMRRWHFLTILCIEKIVTFLMQLNFFPDPDKDKCTATYRKTCMWLTQSEGVRGVHKAHMAACLGMGGVSPLYISPFQFRSSMRQEQNWLFCFMAILFQPYSIR